MLGPHVMQTAMQKENPRFLFNCSLFSVVVFTVSTDLTNWAWLTCLDTRLRIMKSITKSTTVWSDAERCKMLLIAVLIWTVDSVYSQSHVTSSSTSGFSKRLSFKLGHFLSCHRYLTAALTSNWANYSQSTTHLCGLNWDFRLHLTGKVSVIFLHTQPAGVLPDVQTRWLKTATGLCWKRLLSC